MCGLSGLVGPAPAGEALGRVRTASAALHHRGPDSGGFYSQAPRSGAARLTIGSGERDLAPVDSPPVAAPPVAAPPAFGVTLGHRRLAIIDLSAAAAQPFVSDDGRYVLLLNGEIYNYLELRAELLAAGDRFRSASDTEVLLAAWARWGERAIARLTGMFAFALLDRARGVLTLGRDAFGMKPLYYAAGAREFAFASEIAPLLRLADLAPVAAAAPLARFLSGGATDHSGVTMFEGVRAVPAAHLLHVALSAPAQVTVARWWSPDLDARDTRSPASLTDDLRERILSSVRIHLRSDVPAGTMLSGGLDSSTIVMAARRVAGRGADLRTFSYLPEPGVLSEERWIAAVNEASGARSVIVRPSLADWEASLDALVAMQGEPFGSPAVFVQRQLFAAAAAEGVRVMLDGQGGDELFGGYDWARAARMAGHLRRGEIGAALRFDAGVRKARGGGWRASPLRGGLGVLGGRFLRAARRAGGAPALGGGARAAWFGERGVARIPPWRSRGPRVLQERLWHGVHEASLPALLRYADRSAMSVSVEGRLPFLTVALAEFALSLPDALLVDDEGTGKRIVRDAMRGIVPDVVLGRRDKVGFAVPLEAWLARSTRAHGLVDAASRLPCVDERFAARLALSLRGGRRLSPAETYAGWRLVGLAAWAERHRVRFA